MLHSVQNERRDLHVVSIVIVGLDPTIQSTRNLWIPAFAGMTMESEFDDAGGGC
jgi:hypothetical protein